MCLFIRFHGRLVLEKLKSVVFFWCPMGVGLYHLHPTMRKPNESSLGTIFKDKDCS